MVKIISVSPAEYKLIKMRVVYGVHPTIFGYCLIGIKIPENAVCYLHFFNRKSDINIKDLKYQWRNAKFSKDRSLTKKIIDQILERRNNNNNDDSDISVYLVGTDFQLKIWEELMNIPIGETVTYHRIAKAVDCPREIIKTAKVIQSNHIGYLIPCHRTVSKGSRTITSCWKDDSLTTLLKYESQFVEH
ncbi:regulatory protein ada-like [Aphidius gifuensis]|uniref:regulatory protein ada-like n=1 Tax=Aphidius gifuensis TaxID=684658 RepID=UPI001CDC52A2|nr:regulatory protein ada-like [Aphidius gifuensis]